MSFTPSLFFSHMRGKGGPAKPCRFQVVLPVPPAVGNYIQNSVFEKIINFPNSIFNDVTNVINSTIGKTLSQDAQSISSNATLTRYLSLQCEDAELPGKGLYTADAEVYGPTYKVPYKVSYQPITLTFICTNEFEERKLFDKWLEVISPSDTHNMRFPKGTDNNDAYLTNIKIIQYDDNITQIYATELIDAFPLAVYSQRLNWGDGDFHRLSVNIAYHKYNVIYDQSVNIGEVASSVLGTLAASFIPQSF